LLGVETKKTNIIFKQQLKKILSLIKQLKKSGKNHKWI